MNNEIENIPKELNKIINEETDRLMPEAIKELKDKVKARLAIQLLEEIFETKFYQVSEGDLCQFANFGGDGYGINIRVESNNGYAEILDYHKGGITFKDGGNFLKYMFIAE